MCKTPFVSEEVTIGGETFLKFNYTGGMPSRDEMSKYNMHCGVCGKHLREPDYECPDHENSQDVVYSLKQT